MAVVTIISVVLILIGIFRPGSGVWIMAWFVYLVCSISIVGPNQVGLITVFGSPRWLVPRGYGLVFDFVLIYKLHKENAKTTQNQFPGEPEEIKQGKVEPIKIYTADSNTAVYADLDNEMARRKVLTMAGISFDEDLHGMKVNAVEFKKEFGDQVKIYVDYWEKRFKEIPNHRMLEFQNVTFFIRWRITNMLYFFENIGSSKEFIRHARDTMESVVKIEFAKRTTAMIINQRDEIDWMIQDRLNFEMRNEDDKDANWGVHIADAKMVEQHLAEIINKALLDYSEADISIKTETKRGEAEAARKSAASVGTKSSMENEADGEAYRVDKMRKAAGYNSAQMLELDIALGVSENVGNITVVSGGGNGLLGDILGAKAALDASGSKKTSK